MALSPIAFLFVAILAVVQAQLTEQQKQGILDVFNDARATTVLPATNMNQVEWSDILAAAMQKYTDTCQFHFLPNAYTPPPKGSIYLYRDQGRDPVGIAIWRTTRMAPYFDYATGDCINTTKSLEICRHPELYAKVVIAETTLIGCGMTACGPAPKGIIHACAAYTEPKTGGYPFAVKEGAGRCSACPKDRTFCNQGGLCSKTSGKPTLAPTFKTVKPTAKPTTYPTKTPSKLPTPKPSAKPTTWPTKAPSKQPTLRPSRFPTKIPTRKPTLQPTTKPSKFPTKTPTSKPTVKPTSWPTKPPSKPTK